MNTHKLDKEYGLELITDCLTGSSSDDLKKELDEWRSASDENEQLFVRMQKIWNALCLSERDQTFDAQRAYRLFKERVDAEIAMAKQIKLKPYVLLRRVASYAAIVVPLMFLSAFFTYRNVAKSSGGTNMPVLTEVTVPYGSKTQLTLQDGTKLWLNAGSYIRYDSEFARANRSLVLSGEAYFEVAKDERFPFIVDVDGLKIKVLGTHFNVNSYSENGVEVILLEGSVEMLVDKGKTTLQPGDKAVYHVDTRKIDVASGAIPQRDITENEQDVVSPQTVAAHLTGDALPWMNNRLEFNGETFEQIVRTLERNYNVRVDIQNEHIKNRRFVGDFTNNETIEQIFNVMSINGKFRYRISGNIIEIY